MLSQAMKLMRRNLIQYCDLMINVLYVLSFVDPNYFELNSAMAAEKNQHFVIVQVVYGSEIYFWALQQHLPIGCWQLINLTFAVNYLRSDQHALKPFVLQYLIIEHVIIVKTYSYQAMMCQEVQI